MMILIHSFFVRSLFVFFFAIYWEFWSYWSVVYFDNYIFINTIQGIFYTCNPRWCFSFFHFCLFRILNVIVARLLYISRILIVQKRGLFQKLYFYRQWCFLQWFNIKTTRLVSHRRNEYFSHSQTIRKTRSLIQITIRSIASTQID